MLDPCLYFSKTLKFMKLACCVKRFFQVDGVDCKLCKTTKQIKNYIQATAIHDNITIYIGNGLWHAH